MTEREFWAQRVRPLLPSDSWRERVENGLGAGTPDVHYCWRGRSGWIELKYRKVRPRFNDSLLFFDRGLRPAQIAWWVPYLRCGGRGLIVAGVAAEAWAWEASEELVRKFNLSTWDQLRACGRPLTAEQLERWL